MGMKIRDLKPGDVGFGPIRGIGGWAARAGMMLLRDDTKYPHCFMVTSVIREETYAMEARPGGARMAEISDRWTSGYFYVRPAYADALSAHRAALAALDMDGLPYGYMAYPYLALDRINVEGRLIDWYIRRETPDGYPAAPICSQLVDAALERGGIQLYDDGREHHDVTPGDVLWSLLTHHGDVLPRPE